MLSFEEVWDRIKKNEGQVFYTVRGKELTYTIDNNDYLNTNRTDYPLSKSEFRKAYAVHPTCIKDIKDRRGPSYIFAIISDKRIIGE